MLNYNVYPIFPTPMYQAMVDQQIFENSLDHLRKCVNDNTYQEDIVANSKDSSNRYVLDGVPDLKNHIQEHINNYVIEVIGETENKFEIYITSSWSIGLLPGVAHPEHFHANSILSGTLYFDNPPDASPFMMQRETGVGFGHQLNLSPTNSTIYNQKILSIPPLDGGLTLFPSYMRHWVPRNNTQVRRHCVAFDTFVSGKLGTDRTPLYIPK